MTDPTRPPPPDIVDRAAAAVLAAPIPAGPAAELTAATARAIRATAARRRRFRRLVGAGAATAVAAAVAVGLFVLSHDPTAAFTRATAAASGAESFRMVTTQTVGGRVEYTSTAYFAGTRCRQEIGSKVLIGDERTMAALGLDTATRTARRFNLREVPNRPRRQPLSRMMGLFAARNGAGVERLRTETVDGRPAAVFAVRPEPGVGAQMEMLVWIDTGRGRPVRVVTPMNGAWPGGDAVVLEFFDWGAAFDPELFRLDPPDGYKVIRDGPPPVAPPKQ